ncbi:MAG: FAD-binding protein [Gemmatimonadales bacterium]|nr:FAD-binding protein [Gemmatimonadales bacterium]NIN10514.1 FAD-binding protein [Gemmatimonadales bacterium]NIN49301.1 FAD-binding protein [Gemmatimonadales bacterium]NIP06765.1 FAD-binding protein [Gemmatimonadales bacterium]NIR02791.1 FAD-binding protein [Gemmatimonadales bacterium]
MPVVPAGPRYQSWGRYPRVARQDVLQIVWRCDVPRWDTLDRSVLPFGQGRSYGDSCLNEGGVLLDASGLRRFISFDHDHGILACEAGVTLAEILAVTLPRGWILPVIPGTKFVSVGGAIANDIHGKNHHRAGSFGCHVRNLELLRSSGERMTCSPESHSDLFAATVGGLGLTGLILSAELQLARVGTALLEVERIRFGQLNEFFEISEESDATCEHTVAWIDCLAGGRKLGRGVFHRANHVQQTVPAGVRTRGTVALSVPFYAPRVLLNRYTMKAFNTCYYGGQFTTTRKRLTPYERFFFPLDSVRNWNRVYGRPGFLQYQCVVPPRVGRDAIREILERTARAGRGSFLAVLKQFGQRASPGLLSFPRPGLTLALDFPFQGRPTLALCDDLDAVVAQAGGAVYPAKDARMSPEHFARYYPTCDDFLKHMDPRFSSSFWRRVTGATD